MNFVVTNLGRKGRNFFFTHGIIGVLAGLFILFNPQTSFSLISWVFAVWIILDGIFALLYWARARKMGVPSFGLIRGIAQILFGLVVMLIPGVFAALGLFFVSVLALLIGMLNLIFAFATRRIGLRNWWGFLVFGLAAIFFSVFLLVFPRESILSILWIFGLLALLQGVAFIVLGFKLNTTVRAAEKTEQYQRFDGVIEGEVVRDRSSRKHAVDGEIIDDQHDDRVEGNH